MATQSRPLVVLAGPINPDGKSLLEREARVVVCDDETEAGLVRVAAEAAGILFRLRPSCTESLMARCPKLKVVGRHRSEERRVGKEWRSRWSWYDGKK